MRLYVFDEDNYDSFQPPVFSVQVAQSSPTVADLRRAVEERKLELGGKIFIIRGSRNGSPLADPTSRLSDCGLRDGDNVYIADQDGRKITLDRADSPGPPASVWITQGTENSVTVNWLPEPCDVGSPVDGYVVQYKYRKYSREIIICPDYITGTSHTIDDLEESEEYDFWVTAENKSGFGERGGLHCRIGVSPNNVQIRGITNTHVILTWERPRNKGHVYHYKVAKLHRNERWSEEREVDGTEYTWGGLDEGEEYKFRVCVCYKQDPFQQYFVPWRQVDGPSVETKWIITAVQPQQYEATKRELKLMTEELKSLRAENANLLESLESGERAVTELQSQVKDSECEVKEITLKLEKEHDQVIELENELANHQGLIVEKSKQVNDQSSQIASLGQTVATLKVKVREQEEILRDKSQIVEEKSKKVTDLEEGLNAKSEQLEGKEKELQHLRESLHEKEKTIDDLQKNIQELENNNWEMKSKHETEVTQLKNRIGTLIHFEIRNAEMVEKTKRWQEAKKDLEKSLMELTDKYATLCEKINEEEQKTLADAVSDLIPYLSEIRDTQDSQIIPVLSSIRSTVSEQGQATADELDRISQQIDNASVALDGSRTTRVATRDPKPLPDDLKNICMEITKSIGSQWRLLGRSLNLDGDALDEIGAMYEEHGEQEMVWGVLEEWASRTENPSEVTLMKAFENMGNPMFLGDPMSGLDKTKLQRHNDFLLKNMMELSLVASRMFQDEIITLQQLQQLLKCKTRLSGIQALLVLLPSLGCRAFDSFCRALDSSGQSFIADVLLGLNSQGAVNGPTAFTTAHADHHQISESASVGTNEAPNQSFDRGIQTDTGSDVFFTNFELFQAIQQSERNLMTRMQDFQESVVKND